MCLSYESTYRNTTKTRTESGGVCGVRGVRTYVQYSSYGHWLFVRSTSEGRRARQMNGGVTHVNPSTWTQQGYTNPLSKTEDERVECVNNV